ncbi:type II secretion system protein [Paenibacillus sp. YN15]|uniref:type IV pilus modification PilV family protein n=1 Tax=Paenibacillus sp. YN15 TaxID=1742774 RepID=UPI000DCC2404|nr:type II secretion system protein [Paenibacillus sp. YN15]RAV03500.1 hypothetical protein DQG13_07275 [Paenibacillus sp. YN15]
MITTKTAISRNPQRRKWLGDERGISLVEILAAVTIMSIISVTLIGYFVSAMNKSSEQNKRIIAANLARQKAAEIREEYRMDSVKYQLLQDSFTPLTHMLEFNQTNDDQLVDLEGMEINGTRYHFEVQVDNDNSRRSEMASVTAAADRVDTYVLNMRISVYWGTDASNEAQKTSMESYIVRGW